MNHRWQNSRHGYGRYPAHLLSQTVLNSEKKKKKRKKTQISYPSTTATPFLSAALITLAAFQTHFFPPGHLNHQPHLQQTANLMTSLENLPPSPCNQSREMRKEKLLFSVIFLKFFFFFLR